MAKKKRTIPEVLWRLHGPNARTLADTIIHLLPPRPSSSFDCRCKGRRCLGCNQEDDISFLIRCEDPFDYRTLLNDCFVVVCENAPKITVFYPDGRWSQNEIVTRTIEMIMSDSCASPNVICNGYNKCTRTSSVVDLLTTSAWSLLLSRIGDDAMVHLLRFSSVFLPLRRGNHHQVSGSPISDSLSISSKRVIGSACHHPLYVEAGPSKKRKIIDNRDPIRSKLNGELPHSSDSTKAKSIKSVRPCSWQRRRKCRKTNSAEKTVLSSHISTGQNLEELNGEKPQRSNADVYYHAKNVLLFDESAEQQNPNAQANKMRSQCFCSLILQAPQKTASGAEIIRLFMFYKFDPLSTLFPRNHILTTLNPNESGAISLIQNIFGLPDGDLISQSTPRLNSCAFCLTGSTCLCHTLIKLSKNLIRRARFCQYLKLLDKHCTIPATINCVMEEAEFTPQGKESSKKSVHKRPAGPYCTKAQVLSFVWAICRSIVPTDLLGLPSIWRSLKRNISKFIRLRRFEKFCLKQCMQGLKTSCIPFLSDKCYSGYRGNHVLPKCDKSVLKYKLLSCWIYWLFSYLIVPILMANFYVTESEFGKLDIFFYRKSVWEELATRAITCLREQSYSLLDKTSFQRILSQRSFGFSKVRFSPKKNEMRVLANLKAPSRIPAGKEKGKFRHFMAVNNCLRDLNVVLKGLKMGYPEKLGSSVFDYNDVYKKLSPFLIGLKNGSNIVPKTYIVICDVSKAFDSVDQDKLVSVMNDVMLNDQYHVKSSTQVVCSKKSLWVNSEKELLDDNSSHGIAKSTISFPFHSMHSILINQGTSKTIMKEELSRNLHEHVKCNVLQVGKNFYLQEIGIPQGSVLSSLLFSFYYAHLETNSIFPFLEKVHKAHTLEPSSGDLSRSQRSYMLLRFADDFLFISTSEEQAVSFFSRLQRGFREYNCSINEAKSCMNFNMDHTPSNRVYTGKDGISFLPWSGLLINCRTLEIQADYTRYLDIHISSTLTVCWQDKPGPRLKEKLCQFMRPKCHPIFYDSNINSEAVVKLNVYQAFLLCAMKFHCYVHDLSTICTFPPGYYFEMIKSSISYMHKLIVRRMNFMDFGSVVCRIIKVNKGEVQWLGLNAYVRVLKRKQSRHLELLSLLKSELLTHGVAENASLKYAVRDSHSSLFWKIKY